MATETIKPNGDITTGWTPFGGAGDHYTRVDNGISTPTDTQGISSTGGFAEKFDFESPSFPGVCSEIAIRFRAKGSAATAFNIDCALYDGDDEIGYLNIELASTSYGTITGSVDSLALTAADLSDFKLSINHDGEPTAYITEIEAVCTWAFSTSNENTMLSALKTALESITTDNDFQIDTQEVIEGPTVISDHVNRPSIGIYCDRRERVNSAHGRSRSRLHVWLTGYVDAQPNDFDNIWALSADIERILDDSDYWSYSEFTDVKNFNYYFGGPANDMIGILQVELEIDYFYDFGSP